MSDVMQKPNWDVFISHASEDKETVARPLAEALARCGVKVWFDAEQLTLGDSLRRSIDQGLAQSRYGLVILSQSFFAKEWPMKELDGLVAREDGKEKVILPVWHEISGADVRSFSPMLADKLAVSTSKGLENVVDKVLRAISWVERVEPLELELIHIPVGEFLMGSTQEQAEQLIALGVSEEWVERQVPQHTVNLPEYYIAKTPVTNAQYLAFVQTTGHTTPIHWEDGKPPRGDENHPVVNVTWYDATAYCRRLAESTGKAYRLPSEAEWEKAARGTDGRIYPWGNQLDGKRCNSREGGPGHTTPVGQYSAQGDSPYGCADMAGNVWEWTLSLWGKNWERPDFGYPYDPADGREDMNASDDIRRVLRGGAFLVSDRFVRCAYRDGGYPYNWNLGIGFRVCVAA